jgi:hypothetical protein
VEGGGVWVRFSTRRMEQEIWQRDMQDASLAAGVYKYNLEKWKAAHPEKLPVRTGPGESEPPPAENAS